MKSLGILLEVVRRKLRRQTANLEKWSRERERLLLPCRRLLRLRERLERP